MGIRALFRVIDRCNAPTISALVRVPAAQLAINPAHICGQRSTGPVSVGLIVTPQPCAQAMISRAVCGPQLRATARRSAVNARSSSREETTLPLAAAHPVSSTASSLSTFWARVVSVFIGPGARLRPGPGLDGAGDARRPAGRSAARSGARNASPGCSAARWPPRKTRVRGLRVLRRRSSHPGTRHSRLPHHSPAEPPGQIVIKANIYRNTICFRVIIFTVRPKVRLTEELHKQCLRPRATRGCDVPDAQTIEVG